MATYNISESVAASIDTQGDTGTASRIKILGQRDSAAITDQFAVRVRVCNEDTFTNATNATIAVDSGYGTVITTHTSSKDLDIRSLDANATGTLTISGTVPDGETVTIGTRVYEFDTDGSTTGDNQVADISASATASEGTLTVDTQPTALDSFEIDGRGFVFVADGNEGSAGEISIGANLAAAQANIVAAINGTDGVHSAHPTVTAAAFATDASVITANVPGVAGDSITTTENFTAVTNIFDAGTLGTTTAGAECSAANAVTALVAAITADASAVVTAADGAGDTVDVTATADGYDGDSVATTETMSNGAWGAATLATGSIPSEIFVNLTDASAETVTLRLGPPELDGLVCEYHTAAIDVTHAAP